MSKVRRPDSEPLDGPPFHVIFAEVAKMADELEIPGSLCDEADEIEQVMRMIVDVNDEQPKYVTST